MRPPARQASGDGRSSRALNLRGQLAVGRALGCGWCEGTYLARITHVLARIIRVRVHIPGDRTAFSQCDLNRTPPVFGYHFHSSRRKFTPIENLAPSIQTPRYPGIGMRYPGITRVNPNPGYIRDKGFGLITLGKTWRVRRYPGIYRDNPNPG